MLLNENMLFSGAIHLPKRLKNDAISCRWMTTVGDLVILAQYISSRHWLGWLFPVGPWALALLSRSPLLIWRECELLLGLTQTVTEGGEWHHLFVCFIMPQFRSSVVKRSMVCFERKQRRGLTWKILQVYLSIPEVPSCCSFTRRH